MSEKDSTPQRSRQARNHEKPKTRDFTQKRFGMCTSEIVEDPRLTAQAKGAYAVFAGRTNQRGECSLTVQRLASMLGVSRQSAGKYVAELETYGAIVRLSHPNRAARWGVQVGGKRRVFKSPGDKPACQHGVKPACHTSYKNSEKRKKETKKEKNRPSSNGHNPASRNGGKNPILQEITNDKKIEQTAPAIPEVAYNVQLVQAVRNEPAELQLSAGERFKRRLEKGKTHEKI